MNNKPIESPENKALAILDDAQIKDPADALEMLECLGNVFAFYFGHFPRIRGVEFDEEWTDKVFYVHEKLAELVKKGHLLLNEVSKKTDCQTIKK
ncbi:MAG: hypothetical protein ACK4TA_00125 [Saprospiraceae bacterium]